MEYEGGREHADQRRYGGRVTQVRAMQRHPSEINRSNSMLAAGQIVQHVQFRGRIARKSLDECPADISGAPCDEDSHSKRPSMCHVKINS
jgi:hypothetical protein